MKKPGDAPVPCELRVLYACACRSSETRTQAAYRDHAIQHHVAHAHCRVSALHRGLRERVAKQCSQLLRVHGTGHAGVSDGGAMEAQQCRQVLPQHAWQLYCMAIHGKLTDAGRCCGSEKDEVAGPVMGVPSSASGLRAGEALRAFCSCVAADVSSAKGVPDSLREGVARCARCCPGTLMLRYSAATASAPAGTIGLHNAFNASKHEELAAEAPTLWPGYNCVLQCERHECFLLCGCTIQELLDSLPFQACRLNAMQPHAFCIPEGSHKTTVQR